MKKNNFFDQYKDPRWQKKRLEIMQRDEFICRECGSDNSELNVHHRFYDKELKIWEYNNEDLITYCNDCHNQTHDLLNSIKQTCGMMHLEQLQFANDIILKIQKLYPPQCYDVLEYVTNKANE